MVATIEAMAAIGSHLRVLSFEDALRLVLERSAALGLSLRSEAVALLDARERVLAEAIHADRDQPPFDRSTRDGFAGRAADWAGGKWLRVAGQVRAGEQLHGSLESGDAVEIMTGAPVPDGADCVAMVEHVELDEGRVRVGGGRTPGVGENIVPAGSEARAGDVLLMAGTRMGAAEIAVAAACGCALPKVFGRPRVAILPTGDELVELDQVPLPQQIRNSNSYALAALVAEAGGEAVRLPVVPDALAPLLEAIGSARGCDLLLLSGGVSMGKYDLVEEALLSLGAEFFFTGVEMQPGKPVVFGRLPAAASHPEQYFFGLPGNPVSTQVTFAVLVWPLLQALCGAGAQAPRFAQATLAASIKTRRGLTRFLPARIEQEGLRPQVSQVAWQGSGDQAANARANCYLVVPPDTEQMRAGEVATVLLR